MNSCKRNLILHRLISSAIFCLLTAFATGLFAQTQSSTKPWPIHVVIVTTFPGEYRLWGERENLTETVEMPGNAQPLHTSPEHTVLGVISGTTLLNSTTAMMLLGLDARFDLTHAYFIINGIAGIDPEDGSIGSAAWANYVVGDVMRELDPREAPAGWPYGLFPNGASTANPKEVRPSSAVFGTNVYALNPKLVAWAFQQTRDLKLIDAPSAATVRAAYTGYPNAQRPPFVLIGDDFASDHYWHGKTLTQFANDWVRVYTAGKGNFVMTEMEDSGYMDALTRLDSMHRVDINRVLVLRTASNYSMQPPGMTAYDSLTAHYPEGGKLGFESAWLCGSTVLHKIQANWDIFFDHIPGE